MGTTASKVGVTASKICCPGRAQLGRAQHPLVEVAQDQPARQLQNQVAPESLRAVRTRTSRPDLSNIDVPRRMSSRGSVVIQGETDVSTFDDDDPLDFMVQGPLAEPEPDKSIEGSLCVSTRVEYSALPSGRTQDVFGLVTVQAGPCPRASDGQTEERQPMDIVAVLDVSSSMQGDKIRELKSAARFIIEQADPNDRLSLIAFNSKATRALRLRKMSVEGKNDANVATLRLGAGGGTSIAAGVDAALSVLERRRQRNKVSAILLLTDGQDGSTRCRIPELMQRAARANCSIYAFGFGVDHDAALLANIAEQARTPFTYVEESEKIREAFAGTVGGLSSIVAQSVELMVKCWVPLIKVHTEFSCQQTGNQAVVTIPDMFALEHRDILLELSVPASGAEPNKITLLEASARYIDLHGNRIVETAPVIMETQCVEEPQPELEPDVEVSAQRERVDVKNTLRDAAQAGDDGDFEQALNAIASCSQRLISAKKRSPTSEVLVQELADARARLSSRSTWERGGRAETLDAYQMHSMQRATTNTSVPGPCRMSSRSMYCSVTQDRFIRRSSTTL